MLDNAVGKLPFNTTVVGPLATQVAGVTEEIVALCTGGGGVTTTAAQLSFVIATLSRDTAEPAIKDPATLAPVLAVIDD